MGVLSSSVGIMAESRKQVAEIFGADHTFYLINGTTVGIHAAILATCSRNSVCVMARNSHKSVYNAVLLAGKVSKLSLQRKNVAGCRHEYIQPEFDTKNAICHGITPDQAYNTIKNLQNEGEHVGAVCVVSPTYFGAASDVKGPS